MIKALILLFVANAILHVLSYKLLKRAGSNQSTGVLVFVFINIIMAVFLFQGMPWIKWPAIIFPAIGMLGLLVTTILKGEGAIIDYSIFVVDLVTIAIVAMNFFH